jgi:hypothetical protein
VPKRPKNTPQILGIPFPEARQKDETAKEAQEKERV